MDGAFGIGGDGGRDEEGTSFAPLAMSCDGEVRGRGGLGGAGFDPRAGGIALRGGTNSGTSSGGL